MAVFAACRLAGPKTISQSAAGSSAPHWRHGQFPAQILCPGHRPDYTRHKGRDGSAAPRGRHRSTACATRFSVNGTKAGKNARPNVLGKSKIRLPIAGVQIIIENPAHASRAAAVRDKEILIRPSLEFGIILRSCASQAACICGVKMRGIFGIFQAGVQIRPTAKPPGMRASRTSGCSYAPPGNAG